MDDTMASALMEAIQTLRSDDRVHTLPVRSTARKQVIEGHLNETAKAWGVDPMDLAIEIAKAIDPKGEYVRVDGRTASVPAPHP